MNRNRLLNRVLIAIGVSSVISLLVINKREQIKQPNVNLVKHPHELARLFEQKINGLFDCGSRTLMFIHDSASQVEQLIDQIELK